MATTKMDSKCTLKRKQLYNQIVDSPVYLRQKVRKETTIDNGYNDKYYIGNSLFLKTVFCFFCFLNMLFSSTHINANFSNDFNRKIRYEEE